MNNKPQRDARDERDNYANELPVDPYGVVMTRIARLLHDAMQHSTKMSLEEFHTIIQLSNVIISRDKPTWENVR